MVDNEFLVNLIQIYLVFIIYAVAIFLTAIIYLWNKLEKIKLFLIQNFVGIFYGINECIIQNESNQNEYGTINDNENENIMNSKKIFINPSLGIKLTLDQMQSFKTFGIDFTFIITIFTYVSIQFLLVDEFYSDKCVKNYVCYSNNINLTCNQNYTAITDKSDDPFAFHCTSVSLDIKSIGLKLTLISAFAKLFLTISKITFNLSYMFFKRFENKCWMIKNSDCFIVMLFSVLITGMGGLLVLLYFLIEGINLRLIDLIEIMYVCFGQLFIIWLAHKINFDDSLVKTSKVLPVYIDV